MCGRYAATKRPDQLVEEFEVDSVAADELPADFNVAPSKNVYAVLDRELPEAGPMRQLRTVRWGLVPSWAKDPAIGARLINARVETIGEKPAFRRAFAARRCLLPADGYYEWYQPRVEEGQTALRKQPFYIHRVDNRSLALAGLYETWRDPTSDPDDPASLRWTVTVVTTGSDSDVGHIHDRMPLLIPTSGWTRWLDPSAGAPDVADLVAAAGAESLVAYPVGLAVNRVSNNGPELLRPLQAAVESPILESEPEVLF